MNAHPTFASERLRPNGPISALKAWRKRQLVADPKSGGKRSMRLTDVPAQYGIPASTWHAWEQLPGSADFRRPGDDNMQLVCGEITKGELSPADFYPPVEVPEASGGG